jgi:hypothetical protein
MIESDYKIIVAVYLRGDDLDPMHISEVIGVNPTRSQYKGQKNITSTNKEFSSKIGMWSLVSGSRSSKVSDHVNELIAQLGECGNMLSSISGVDEAYVDIFIASETDGVSDVSCDFELNKEALSALAVLSLPVRFSVNMVGSD